MATQDAFMQQRRDTAANWTSGNPTLRAGEIGFETDTGRFKIGDGATAWNSRSYAGAQRFSANMLYDSQGNLYQVANQYLRVPVACRIVRATFIRNNAEFGEDNVSIAKVDDLTAGTLNSTYVSPAIQLPTEDPCVEVTNFAGWSNSFAAGDVLSCTGNGTTSGALVQIMLEFEPI